MTPGRSIVDAIRRACASDGLGRITASVIVFAAAIFLLNGLAITALGLDDGILGHTGPGRIVVYLIGLALALFFQRVAANPLPLGFGRIVFGPRIISRGFLFGIAGYFTYALMMWAAGAVEFRSPKSIADVAAAVPVCAVSGLGIATVEEIIFRGFLLRSAAGALPRWPAIILTGILFGFFHELANPGDLLAEPADRMLFGGVFCLHLLLSAAAIRTRSLHLGIGIHSGLVFGEALFRRLRLFDVADDNSWFLGLDGDPRRGFLSWALFLGATLLIPRIMGRSAMAAVADRKPISFAPAAPPWLTRSLDRLASIGNRGEWAWWAAIACLAVAIRAFMVVDIPLALSHDGSASLLSSGAAFEERPPRGWLMPVLVRSFSDGETALLPLVCFQHVAVILGLALLFLALRSLLGKGSLLPLAACAAGCAVHGLPIYLSHHVLPGALQFALNALAISLWALRLTGGGSWLAFASAFTAAIQGFNGFITWPLIAVILTREIASSPPGRPKFAGVASALVGGALPVIGGWLILQIHPVSYIRSVPIGRLALSTVAHLGPEISPADRAAAFQRLYRPLAEQETDPERRNRLCLKTAWGLAKDNPRGAFRSWRSQIYALLCRGSDNISYPGETDLRRTARYTAKATGGPAMAMHHGAGERLPRFLHRTPMRAPEISVWFFLVMPPFVATSLCLILGACMGSAAWRWLAVGCLAIWVPAVFRLSLSNDVAARDVAGLTAVAMFVVSAAMAMTARAMVSSLRGNATKPTPSPK